MEFPLGTAHKVYKSTWGTTGLTKFSRELLIHRMVLQIPKKEN